jgi:hypothetical protein
VKAIEEIEPQSTNGTLMGILMADGCPYFLAAILIRLALGEIENDGIARCGPFVFELIHLEIRQKGISLVFRTTQHAVTEEKIQTASETDQSAMCKEVIRDSWNVSLTIPVCQGARSIINIKGSSSGFFASLMSPNHPLDSCSTSGVVSSDHAPGLLNAPEVADGIDVLLQVLRPHVGVLLQYDMQPQYELMLGD